MDLKVVTVAACLMFGGSEFQREEHPSYLHLKELYKLHSTNTDKETLGKYYEDKTVRRYDLEEQTAYAHSHILPSDLPDDETTSHNI